MPKFSLNCCWNMPKISTRTIKYMPKISKYAYQIISLHQELTENVSHKNTLNKCYLFVTHNHIKTLHIVVMLHVINI